MRDRVEKLERLAGKLTLENQVLKRGWQHSLSRSQRNGRPSRYEDVPVSSTTPTRVPTMPAVNMWTNSRGTDS